MWYVLGGWAAVIGLAIAYAWWDSRADRAVEKKLRTCERLRTEAEYKLEDSQWKRHHEAMEFAERRVVHERTVKRLRSHIDDLEELVARAGGDELHLARLRSELSGDLATLDSEEQEAMSGPSPTDEADPDDPGAA